jgi:hypothetical protein
MGSRQRIGALVLLSLSSLYPPPPATGKLDRTFYCGLLHKRTCPTIVGRHRNSPTQSLPQYGVCSVLELAEQRRGQTMARIQQGWQGIQISGRMLPRRELQLVAFRWAMVHANYGF